MFNESLIERIEENLEGASEEELEKLLDEVALKRETARMKIERLSEEYEDLLTSVTDSEDHRKEVKAHKAQLLKERKQALEERRKRLKLVQKRYEAKLKSRREPQTERL